MEQAMKRYLIVAVCLLFAAAAVYAATKEQKRLENCGVVMQEILNIPDNLPQQVLAKAECVIVFPSVLKLAFGMGKDYGRGNGLPHRQGIQRTLGRSRHVRPRRR
jgi:lipid-binding SYLF domain-containing protein